MIETPSVESLGQQLATLTARADEIVERHRQLVAQRPDMALRAYQDQAGSRDQLDSLNAEIVVCGQQLADINAAVGELTRQLDEAEQRERAERESQLAQERYVEEVRRIDTLRQRNRVFVQAALAFWEAWGAFESDQELALALHRFHFLGIQRATDHQKSLLLGRLAGDLSLGANPLQGEGDLEP